MKPPSPEDTVVRVSAWLTDEAFGYTHWRAAQFSAPQIVRHGVLLLFATEEEANAAAQAVPPAAAAVTALRALVEAVYRIQNDWDGTRVGAALAQADAVLFPAKPA